MIIIDRKFDKGYIRPLGRGIVLGGEESEEYLDDLLEEAVGDAYSLSGGCKLTGIHIVIKIEGVEKH